MKLFDSVFSTKKWRLTRSKEEISSVCSCLKNNKIEVDEYEENIAEPL